VVVRIVDEVSERGVTERRFDVDADGRTVPGVLWTPTGAPAKALVLVGHGAWLEKRSPYILSLARRLVRHHGIAAAAIDGPEHGERDRTGSMWWSDEQTDAMVADWKATLAACRASDEIGANVPLGYWGFSMGTIFGLPFVASEPDVQVAVLGLMGAVGPTAERLAKAATALATQPLLFAVQWDDELVPRDKCIELFGLFATTDKRMIVNPGSHAFVPLETFELTEAFLAKHLVPVPH
jgi:dienelactone hydrolase